MAAKVGATGVYYRSLLHESKSKATQREIEVRDGQSMG